MPALMHLKQNVTDARFRAQDCYPETKNDTLDKPPDIGRAAKFIPIRAGINKNPLDIVICALQLPVATAKILGSK